jgi:Protein of unknown function (DUF3828)
MRVWMIAPLILAANVACAAPQSAESFLQGIYSHYHGSDDIAKGVMLDKPADIRRYFAPDLAALMNADDAAAAKAGDVPELDGDPFIDAQDWDITKLIVHIDSEDAKQAKATVRFLNFKKPDVVRLSLVMTPQGWRISDIAWQGNEGTLRDLYEKK